MSRRILVVDDDADTRESMRRLLEQCGHSVLCAAGGSEALSLLHDDLPCLILLDLRMPEMDGWQFRQQLWREPSLAAIPVVLISAENDLHKIAGSLHAAAHFRKPVDIPQLLRMLRKVRSRTGYPRFN
jgi:two-component system chemotaxis response regulator CheY